MMMMLIPTCGARWLLLVSTTLLVAVSPTASAFVSLPMDKSSVPNSVLQVASSWSSSSSSSSSQQWIPSPMGSSLSAEPRVSSVRAYSMASSNMRGERYPVAELKRNYCYYKVLGVSQSADSAELKQAFRRLVKNYHPDANPHTDTTVQFQMINHAYKVLSDPQQRQRYNARMNYANDTPHFVVTDLEGYNSQRREQSDQFGNLSNDRNGGWHVRDDGRMFLTDNDNNRNPFGF